MKNVQDVIFIENIVSDIEGIYKNHMLNKGLEPKNNGYFFFQYMNFIERNISNRSRKILESSRFEIPIENKKGYEQLKKEIIAGNDINSYQSNELFNPQFVDKLFNFEGLVHLHLGEKLTLNKSKTRTYIERTKNVAIALITDEKVYFISVQPHGKGYGNKTWVNKEYLEVLAIEFPEIIKNRIIKEEGDNFDFETIRKCRDLGINYSTKVNELETYRNLPVMVGIGPIKVEHRIKLDKINEYVKNWVERVKEKIRDKEKKGTYQINLIEMTREENGFPDKLIFKILKDGKEYGEYEIS
ncbi:hypothetical protein MNY64_18195 (plasmid) [Moellerella wisconsensis]|uniref:hypothetical protein n=1 Tax=Moellerella wisconsensis TaxID=158849 RepID=UPI001F4DC7BA|nr:hypothetical protein [Moellerella wisconsensis]UNH29330.1 hypothetical protein MNY64_18195 [Moellerella wisconsensis]